MGCNPLTNGKGISMDARFGYYDNSVAAKFIKYINSAGAVVSNSSLPTATQNLVKIRASQINGCSVCTDMHTKDYDDDQLGALVSLTALINAYNRVNVITRQPAGDYQPGQWG